MVIQVWLLVNRYIFKTESKMLLFNVKSLHVDSCLGASEIEKYKKSKRMNNCMY